ncbi:MAG: ComEC/Rec2 family competence protein [Gemmobacter sp.]|uniref:ComEC/Rec2 family competence protein n=1 Tax=Gemmobacter sp. TaxID=1898957 RepID=UPI00391BC13A
MGGVGAWLAAERGRLFLWVPVCMGLGIALWLAWPGEPGPAAYVGAFGLAVAGLGLWGRQGVVTLPLGAALVSLAVGFLSIGARSDRVAGPVLGFRYYGPVEGRIVEIDRSQADKPRLTLDRVVLERVPPERTPARVRVALHGDQGFVDPIPGLRVMMTAHLSPPDGPVEPGGFDFQRMAWFRSLGAVGYTRTPVLAQGPPPRLELALSQLRMRLSQALQAAIPGPPGAFAAAMLTGDRSGVDQATTQALRDSNLYHLVSISGMHMGLLTGFVFFAVRLGLALVPPVALRLPTKKLAAVVALAAAAFYLLLSGGDVATTRAFVMVAVMLGAVLVDRRAISLRSVAIAALILLLVQPEAMAEPGFQMSFGATAALVAAFGALHDHRMLLRLPAWGRPVAVLVVSSLVAGFASAPFAAVHFNRFSDYGLVANLAAGPVMGVLVMPAGVLSAMLAPLGLAQPALWALGLGCGWILAVSQEVASWPGAVTLVPQAGAAVLPLVAVGGLALVLLRGRLRLVGVVPLGLALFLWQAGTRPDLLIAADGGLVGLMGPQGRALSLPRGNGFAAQVWLENDGDRVSQEQAAARPGFAGGRGDRRFWLDGVAGAHLTGKGAEGRLPAVCAEVAIVILAAPARQVPEGCLVIDQTLLAQTGPLAVQSDETGGWRFAATRPDRARRWSPRPSRARGEAPTPRDWLETLETQLFARASRPPPMAHPFAEARSTPAPRPGLAAAP